MGDLVEDREATVRAVLRVADFEEYMRHNFDSSRAPLVAIYDPCGGITYADGFTQDMFRSWQQHLVFMEWEELLKKQSAEAGGPWPRLVKRD